GSHVVATGFIAEGVKATGLRAASFTVRGFVEVRCFGDLPCFDEPASLTSIGRSAIAAIAAIMVRRRDQNPVAIPLRKQINFMFPPKNILPQGRYRTS